MINTYSQLNFFFKNLNPENSIDKKILNKIKKNKLSNEFKVLISLVILNYSLNKGESLFRSNRYFLDALGLKVYPDLISLKKCYSLLLKFYHIKKKKNFYALVNKLLNQKIKKTKDKNTSKIFKTERYEIKKNQIAFFKKHGYLVIKNALSNRICEKLQKRINKIAIEEKKNKKAYIYGSGRLQRIYHLIHKDKIFQDVLLHPLISRMCEFFFNRETLHDKYYLSSWHANILYPGAEDHKYHVDVNVPNPLPNWPVRLNVNLITQDYNKINGSTICIPGSHKYLKNPKKINNNHLKIAKTLTAPKGSLVFWTGHLWHKSGKNNSNSKRVAILGCFANSVLRELVMEENPFVYNNKSKYISKDIKNLLGWTHGIKD